MRHMSSQQKPLGPVIAAAVSPRRAREHSIDLAATLELIDFLYDGGVDGIALLGSTGEFVHFVLEDRSRMLDFAVKRSRLPILVNVSHSTLDGAILLGQEAADSGVAGVLIMPPYYFRYSQEAVLSFLLSFGEAVARLVPVYLYNIPVFSNEIALHTATSLLGSALFAGIKDSSGDWANFEGLLALRAQRKFVLFPGDDRLYARGRAAGADGVVSGVACALPELVARLDRAIRERDTTRTEALNARVVEFLDRIAPFPVPVGVKEAVRHRKMRTGALAVPLGEATERQLDGFRAWFAEWLPARAERMQDLNRLRPYPPAPRPAPPPISRDLNPCTGWDNNSLAAPRNRSVCANCTCSSNAASSAHSE